MQLTTNKIALPIELVREIDALLSKVSNLATFHHDLERTAARAQHLRTQLHDVLRESL